jgi:uncharacterized RDD family membrane protein YckC
VKSCVQKSMVPPSISMERTGIGRHVAYPNLLRRYVATLLDMLLLWFSIYGITRVPALVNSDSGVPIAAVAVILAYEPIFTSRLCTLGQALMGIRVRTPETLDRIPIYMAYFRLFVKYVLGGISLLTIPARKDRRAIHDIAADSIMIDARMLRREA